MNTDSRLTSRTAIFAYTAVVAVVAAIIGALFIAPLLDTERQFANYNVDNANVAIHGYDTVAVTNLSQKRHVATCARPLLPVQGAAQPVRCRRMGRAEAGAGQG